MCFLKRKDFVWLMETLLVSLMRDRVSMYERRGRALTLFLLLFLLGSFAVGHAVGGRIRDLVARAEGGYRVCPLGAEACGR